MLPQFTGLALSIAAIITGGLITELVFSYPGLGSLLFAAIGQNDYPVISAITPKSEPSPALRTRCVSNSTTIASTLSCCNRLGTFLSTAGAHAR